MGDQAKLKGSIGDIGFFYNPRNVKTTIKNNYALVAILNKAKYARRYLGGNPKIYVFDIFFDNKGHDTTTTDDQIKLLNSYMEKADNSNAPPVVFMYYGDDIMGDVIVLDVDIVSRRKDFSLHTTRTGIKLTIAEYVEDERSRTSVEEKGERVFYVDTNNKTFRNIAYQEYGDASLEDAICDFNPKVLLVMDGITIPQGTYLIIPAWDDAKKYKNEDVPGLLQVTL